MFNSCVLLVFFLESLHILANVLSFLDIDQSRECAKMSLKILKIVLLTLINIYNVMVIKSIKMR